MSYSNAGLGDAVTALTEALGGGKAAGDRFRNMAYAEHARSNIRKTDEETLGLRQQREAASGMAGLIREAQASGQPLGQAVIARLAPFIAMMRGQDAPAARLAAGTAALGAPDREQAVIAGGIGNDAGNTVYGVDQKNATQLQGHRLSAGATVAAAQAHAAATRYSADQREAGLDRRLVVQPGADGAYVGPGAQRLLGMSVQPGAGPQFLPGARTVAGGATSVSPPPGPMLDGEGNPRPMERFTAPAAARAATNPDASNVAEAQEIVRGLASPDPAIRERAAALEAAYKAQGISVRDLALKGLAVQETRNAGAANVQGLRNDGALGTQFLRNSGAMERAAGSWNNRIDVTRLAGELRNAGIAQQQAGATQRTGMQQAGATERTGMQQTGATERTGMAQAGATERTGMTQTGQNERQTQALGTRVSIADADRASREGIAANAQAGMTERADLAARTKLEAIRAKPPRPLSAAGLDSIEQATATMRNADPEAREVVGALAGRLLGDGQATTGAEAVQMAAQLLNDAGATVQDARRFLGLPIPGTSTTRPAPGVNAGNVVERAGLPARGAAPAPAAPTAPQARTQTVAAQPAGGPPASSGGIPPRPPTVPPGSAYSASRGLWRTPQGQVFTADGQPVGAR